MKNMSIRLKITLWFSAALILVVAFTYFAVLAVSNQVIQKTIRDGLINTVKNNIDEVEYFSNLEDTSLEGDVDVILPYLDGYLEVDDDFLDEVNQIYTTLYYVDGTFIYGENPIAEETVGLKFLDSQMQKLTVGKTLYYVFDCKLTGKGLDGLWMRGVVSEKQGAVQLTSIARTSLILLPTFVLIAILGGSLIAGRALRPIKQLSTSAAQIQVGGDLQKRIDLGKGNDELHQLADQFNAMLDRLEAAFQAERQFTSDASHELRTPMAVIMAQCELVLEQECDPQEYEEALQIIRRQGSKMSKLIADLLDVSRLEMNTQRYAVGEVRLSELAEAVCADMAMLKEQNISLQWDLLPDITIQGNGELMARLLTNLISNAYRYGKENGSILVSLKREGQQVRLSVRDDGVGIAQAEQEKIFQRFYQVDGAHSGAGTGLGLAMVQQIARFHGGTVTVESELGKGSTFTAALPQKPEHSL